MAGTAELVALELGKLLQPVQSRLQDGDLEGLFGDLGLPLPASVRTATDVVSAASSAATALGNLAPKVAQLAVAVAAGDDAQIAQRFGEVVPLAKAAFTALSELATKVKAAYEALSPPAELGQILAQLPERLLNFTVVSYLERERPLLGGTLGLFGLIESVEEPAQGTRPGYVRRSIRLDRLPVLLDDPAKALEAVYHWGDSAQALDAQLFLKRLHGLLAALGVPAVIEPAVPRLRAFLLALEPGTGTPTPLELTLDVVDFTGVDEELPVSQRWAVRLRATGSLDLGTGIRVEPPFTLVPIAPAPSLSGKLTVGFERTPGGGGSMLLFGQAGGTRLQAQSVTAAFGAQFQASGTSVSADLVVDAEITDGRLVVNFGGADGFLASFLPAASELDFDLGVRWSKEDGLVLRGGVALLVTVPLTVELGPLRLDRLDLKVTPNAQGLALETRVTGGIALGPFAAAVDGIGVGTELAFRQGNLGPVDVTFAFLAPRGLGLSIDAGPVQGGGFILFDEPAGRYAGLFQVNVAAIGVTVIGILDTKVPGGGFALLVVLRGQFPPIQVGFGFALSSIGGLLALNRRIDVDALRARFATGTAGRILAPEDPVRNAPVLLADLTAVFPPTAGVVVVGPTVQLSWAELVRFDLGIFVELPGPTKIVLLGSARATIDNPGGGGPILQLRLDIIGLLDFAKRVLEFDAVLVDSLIMEVLELSGGAAFRLSWGEQPYVLLSVGGFHPAFSPAPLVLPPSLTRVAMTRGSPSDFLYLRFEGYFAVTTNTLQLGASVEAAVNAGPINARGFLGFDALIRFQPFFFQFDFEASFRVRFQGVTLAAVKVRGELSGPGPITFHGRCCIEILFFEICFEATFTLGSENRPTTAPVASAVSELAGELGKPANLTVAGGTDRFAVVEPATGASLPVVSPLGQVSWTQSRAPLGLLLQRFEGAPLAQAETVTATGAAVTGSAVDWFAPGSFAELSDGDALNRKAFERLDGGVTLGAPGLADGPKRTHVITVEQIRLPQAAPVTGFDFAIPGWLVAAVGARTGHVERPPVIGVIGVHDERWQVRGTDGAVNADGLSESQAHQLTAVGVGAAAVPRSDQVAPIPF